MLLSLKSLRRQQKHLHKGVKGVAGPPIIFTLDSQPSNLRHIKNFSSIIYVQTFVTRLFGFLYDYQLSELPLMLYSNHSHHTVDVEAVVNKFISLNSSRKDNFGAPCKQTVNVHDGMQFW